MPIAKVEVSEYECCHCHYKWINRVNGKDGPIPRNCAKCKRLYWNGKDETYNPISPTERRLRNKLKTVTGEYELVKTFLNLKPRPTMKELNQALYPIGYVTSRDAGMIKDPDNPGWRKFDREAFHKLYVEQREKRLKFMKKVIRSR